MSATKRKLARNVWLPTYYKFYPVGSVPEPEHAKLITNPNAWDEEPNTETVATADEGDQGEAQGSEPPNRIYDTGVAPAKPDYASWSKADLEAEINARNDAGDGTDWIVPKGRNKSDFVAALEADDANR